MRSETTDAGGAAPPGGGAPGAPPTWVDAPGYHVFHVTRRTAASDVYLAYHRPTSAFRDLVVVRRVPDAEHDALRRTVEAEVAAAAAVAHPGVAPVQEVGLTADGRLFVAVARPVGRTLREVVAEDGPLRPARRALELGLTLADAVAAAHERGLAHGWLGPDSVVLATARGDAPERLVVLGVGTAAAQGGVAAPGAPPPEQAPYTSPERAAGGPPTVRGDVFSLGSVLLGMITGGPPPVVGAGSADVGAGPAPSAATLVLRQARAADPGRRYSSARDLATALRAVGDVGVEPLAAALTPVVFAPVARRAASVAAPVASLEHPALGSATPAAFTRGRGRRLPLVAAGLVGLAAIGGATFARRRAEVAAAPPPAAPPERAARTQQVPITPAPVIPSPQVAAAAPTPAAPALSVPTPAAPAAPAPVPRASSPRTAVVAEVAPTPQPTPRSTAPTAAAAAPADVPVRALARAPVPAAVASAGEVAAARAESAAGAPPAAAVAPASAPTIAPVTAPAVPAATEVANSLTGAYAALSEYLGAIEARDLDRLARAYPGMPGEQRRAWAAFFGGVADFRPRLVVDQIRPAGAGAGATARAHVRGAYEYENVRPRRAERRPVSFNVTLARDASGWRVRAVE